MTRADYLKRLSARKLAGSLQSNIEFAIVLGWVLVLLGAFKYWIELESKFWLYMFYAGISLFLIAHIYPFAAHPARKLMGAVGGWIGDKLLKAVLSVVYFLVVLPAGTLLRNTSGQGSFYRWASRQSASGESWVDKSLTTSIVSGGALRHAPAGLKVISHFMQNRQFIVLPSLLIFLLLALIGFIAQSSALAPMIYTLF